MNDYNLAMLALKLNMMYVDDAVNGDEKSIDITNLSFGVLMRILPFESEEEKGHFETLMCFDYETKEYTDECIKIAERLIKEEK